MFRIAFMVEDKNLPKVLRDVAGSVKDLDVRPVVNALPSAPKARKVRAASGGDVQSMLLQKLQRYDTFTHKEAMLGLKELGRPSTPGNARSHMKLMMKKGTIIRVDTGVYVVNKTQE